MRKILLFVGIFFLCIQVIAQTPHAKGKVVDENNAPIPGVTIMNKKTSKVVGIADAQGAFDISLNEAATLVFSSIEFEPKEAPSSQSMSIVLKANVQALA